MGGSGCCSPLIPTAEQSCWWAETKPGLGTVGTARLFQSPSACTPTTYEALERGTVV